MIVRIDGGQVDEVELNIYEPPRFFEAFLRGRGFREAPDITARICGICPVAYQMSAVQRDGGCLRRRGQRASSAPAAAPLLRRVDREPRAARLHAPRARLPRLRRARSSWPATTPRSSSAALRLKKTGNELMTRRRRPRDAPDQRPGRRLLPGADAKRELAHARRAARACTRDRARDRPLDRRLRLPRLRARLRARRARRAGRVPDRPRPDRLDRGLDIAVAEYDEHFVEEHVERSNALHSRLRERGPTSAARSRGSRSRATGSRRSPRGRRRGGPRRCRAQPVPEHRRPLRRARLRLRRGAAADRRATSSRTRRRSPVEPRAGVGYGAPRRRAASSTTATSSTTTARSSTPRSCRRPRRTSGRSRRTCAVRRALARPRRRRARAPSASRRSATTTRASPARRTS